MDEELKKLYDWLVSKDKNFTKKHPSPEEWATKVNDDEKYRSKLQEWVSLKDKDNQVSSILENIGKTEVKKKDETTVSDGQQEDITTISDTDQPVKETDVADVSASEQPEQAASAEDAIDSGQLLDAEQVAEGDYQPTPVTVPSTLPEGDKPSSDVHDLSAPKQDLMFVQVPLAEMDPKQQVELLNFMQHEGLSEEDARAKHPEKFIDQSQVSELTQEAEGATTDLQSGFNNIVNNTGDEVFKDDHTYEEKDVEEVIYNSGEYGAYDNQLQFMNSPEGRQELITATTDEKGQKLQNRVINYRILEDAFVYSGGSRFSEYGTPEKYFSVTVWDEKEGRVTQRERADTEEEVKKLLKKPEFKGAEVKVAYSGPISPYNYDFGGMTSDVLVGQAEVKREKGLKGIWEDDVRYLFRDEEGKEYYHTADMAYKDLNHLWKEMAVRMRDDDARFILNEAYNQSLQTIDNEITNYGKNYLGDDGKEMSDSYTSLRDSQRELDIILSHEARYETFSKEKKDFVDKYYLETHGQTYVEHVSTIADFQRANIEYQITEYESLAKNKDIQLYDWGTGEVVSKKNLSEKGKSYYRIQDEKALSLIRRVNNDITKLEDVRRDSYYNLMYIGSKMGENYAESWWEGNSYFDVIAGELVSYGDYWYQDGTLSGFSKFSEEDKQNLINLPRYDEDINLSIQSTKIKNRLEPIKGNSPLINSYNEALYDFKIANRALVMNEDYIKKAEQDPESGIVTYTRSVYAAMNYPGLPDAESIVGSKGPKEQAQNFVQLMRKIGVEYTDEQLKQLEYTFSEKGLHMAGDLTIFLPKIAGTTATGNVIGVLPFIRNVTLALQLGTKSKILQSAYGLTATMLSEGMVMEGVQEFTSQGEGMGFWEGASLAGGSYTFSTLFKGAVGKGSKGVYDNLSNKIKMVTESQVSVGGGMFGMYVSEIVGELKRNESFGDAVNTAFSGEDDDPLEKAILLYFLTASLHAIKPKNYSRENVEKFREKLRQDIESRYRKKYQDYSEREIDDYKLLGLKPGASKDELEAAYLEASEPYADKGEYRSPEVLEEFMDVHSAYNRIKNYENGKTNTKEAINEIKKQQKQEASNKERLDKADNLVKKATVIDVSTTDKFLGDITPQSIFPKIEPAINGKEAAFWSSKSEAEIKDTYEHIKQKVKNGEIGQIEGQQAIQQIEGAINRMKGLDAITDAKTKESAYNDIIKKQGLEAELNYYEGLEVKPTTIIAKIKSEIKVIDANLNKISNELGATTEGRRIDQLTQEHSDIQQEILTAKAENKPTKDLNAKLKQLESDIVNEFGGTFTGGGTDKTYIESTSAPGGKVSSPEIEKLDKKINTTDEEISDLEKELGEKISEETITKEVEEDLRNKESLLNDKKMLSKELKKARDKKIEERKEELGYGKKKDKDTEKALDLDTGLYEHLLNKQLTEKLNSREQAELDAFEKLVETAPQLKKIKEEFLAKQKGEQTVADFKAEQAEIDKKIKDLEAEKEGLEKEIEKPEYKEENLIEAKERIKEIDNELKDLKPKEDVKEQKTDKVSSEEQATGAKEDVKQDAPADTDASGKGAPKVADSEPGTKKGKKESEVGKLSSDDAKLDRVYDEIEGSAKRVEERDMKARNKKQSRARMTSKEIEILDQRVNDRAREGALEYLVKSEWYENATEAQRDAAFIEVWERFGGKKYRRTSDKQAMKIQAKEQAKKEKEEAEQEGRKITGDEEYSLEDRGVEISPEKSKKDVILEKNILVNEAEMLKTQLRLEANAARDVKAVIRKIKTYIDKNFTQKKNGVIVEWTTGDAKKLYQELLKQEAVLEKAYKNKNGEKIKSTISNIEKTLENIDNIIEAKTKKAYIKWLEKNSSPEDYVTKSGKGQLSADAYKELVEYTESLDKPYSEMSIKELEEVISNIKDIVSKGKKARTLIKEKAKKERLESMGETAEALYPEGETLETIEEIEAYLGKDKVKIENDLNKIGIDKGEEVVSRLYKGGETTEITLNEAIENKRSELERLKEEPVAEPEADVNKTKLDRLLAQKESQEAELELATGPKKKQDIKNILSAINEQIKELTPKKGTDKEIEFVAEEPGIAAEEASSIEGSIDTLTSGERDIAAVTLTKKQQSQFKKEGYKLLDLWEDGTGVFVVYRDSPGAEADAIELKNLIREQAKEHKKEKDRRIGELLNYKKSDIDKFINRNYNESGEHKSKEEIGAIADLESKHKIPFGELEQAYEKAKKEGISPELVKDYEELILGYEHKSRREELEEEIEELENRLNRTPTQEEVDAAYNKTREEIESQDINQAAIDSQIDSLNKAKERIDKRIKQDAAGQRIETEKKDNFVIVTNPDGSKIMITNYSDLRYVDETFVDAEGHAVLSEPDANRIRNRVTGDTPLKRVKSEAVDVVKKGGEYIIPSSLQTIKTLLERLGAGDPVLKAKTDKLYEDLVNADTRQAVLVDQLLKQYKLLKKEAGVTGSKLLKQNPESKNIIPQKNPDNSYRLTNAEIVDLYMLLEAEGAMRLEKTGVDVEALVEYMDANPELKVYADKLFEFYEGTKDIFEPVFEQITGRTFAEFNRDPDGNKLKYMPVWAEGTGDKAEEDAFKVESGGFLQNIKSKLSGKKEGYGADVMTDRFKQRSNRWEYNEGTGKYERPLGPYQIAGSEAKLLDYIKSMSHTKEYYDISLQVNELLNAKTRGPISLRIGQSSLKETEMILNQIVGGGNRYLNQVDKWISGFGTGSIIYTLAFSTRNIIKQATSLTHWYTAGIKDGISVTDVLNHSLISRLEKIGTTGEVDTETMNFIIDLISHPSIRSRYKNVEFDPAFDNFAAQAQNIKTWSLPRQRRFLKKWLIKLMMSPTTIGDIIGVLGGGIPYALAYRTKLLKEGVKMAEANRIASEKMIKLTNELQQSRKEYGTTSLQRSAGGRILWAQYKSAQIQGINKQLQTINQFRNWDILDARGKKQVLYDMLYWTVFNAGFTAASTGFLADLLGLSDSDDATKKRTGWDWAEASIAAELQGLGIAGSIVEQIFNHYVGESWKNNVPAVKFIEDMTKKVFVALSTGPEDFVKITEEGNLGNLLKNFTTQREGIEKAINDGDYDKATNLVEKSLARSTMTDKKKDAIIVKIQKFREKEDLINSLILTKNVERIYSAIKGDIPFIELGLNIIKDGAYKDKNKNDLFYKWKYGEEYSPKEKKQLKIKKIKSSKKSSNKQEGNLAY